MYLQRWLLWEKMWIKYVWMNLLFRIWTLSNYFFVTFPTSLISECNCFKKGSTCIRCDENGKCKCKKPYYTGDKCDKCIDGRHKPEENCLGKIWKLSFISQRHGIFFKNNIPTQLSCLECKCNEKGVKKDCKNNDKKDMTCDANGKCNCDCNIKGDKCTECNVEYYNWPICQSKWWFWNYEFLHWQKAFSAFKLRLSYYWDSQRQAM